MVLGSVPKVVVINPPQEHYCQAGRMSGRCDWRSHGFGMQLDKPRGAWCGFKSHGVIAVVGYSLERIIIKLWLYFLRSLLIQYINMIFLFYSS